MKHNKKIGLIVLFVLQIIACYTLSLFSMIGSTLLPFFFFIFHIKEDVAPLHKLGGAFIWLCSSILLYSQFPSLLEVGLFTLHVLLTLWITSFNKNQQLMRTLSITTIIVASLMLILLLPYVRIVISYFMQWAALGVGYLLNPLFQSISSTDRSEANDIVNKMTFQKPPQLPDGKEYDPFIMQMVTISIILLVATYVVWKLYKKRNIIQLDGFSFSESGVVPSEYTVIKERKKTLRPPNNAIRKEIFKLEKKLKPPFNRKRGETFGDWMNRMQTTGTTNIQWNIIIDTYNAARYANNKNTELLKQFKNEVNKLYKYQKGEKRKSI